VESDEAIEKKIYTFIKTAFSRKLCVVIGQQHQHSSNKPSPLFLPWMGII